MLRKVSSIQSAPSDTEAKVLSILKVLSESSEPMGSIMIARELKHHGVSLSERAVRYHLRITDARGYTCSHGRDGRAITPTGIEELQMALVPARIGSTLDKLELLAFLTTFNPRKKSGRVAINTSLFHKEDFSDALAAMRDVFQNGICVSELVAIASEGESLGDTLVPEGKVGFGTICSATINGVLLKAGVPVESIFGGVLEIRNSQPQRFVAIVNYNGTSLDPSEQYIRARMTTVSEAARSGNGMILANFREIPAPARLIVEETTTTLKQAGIGGVYVIGNTSEPLCQVAVGLNRTGIILLGGLNPVAAVVEAGIEVENTAESGMIDFEQLTSFHQL